MAATASASEARLVTPRRPLDDDEDFAALPRRQTGNAPQNLTLMLLAEYGLWHRAWFPSAAIVALLGEFGVGTANARAAISRLARRGVLERARCGRSTSYRLARATAATLAEGGRLLAGFDAVAEAWDGTWTLVAFSLPQDRDSGRRALRNQLRWFGFAPLYDGLWISPRGLPEHAARKLTAVTPAAVTAFRGTRVGLAAPAGREPLDAWNLPETAGQYDEFLRRWGARRERLCAEPPIGAVALGTRMELLTDYRPLPLLDPPVPMRLMPQGWPRVRAARVFAAIYDSLGAPACGHVLDLVGGDGDGPGRIRPHTVAELAAGIVVR